MLKWRQHKKNNITTKLEGFGFEMLVERTYTKGDYTVRTKRIKCGDMIKERWVVLKNNETLHVAKDQNDLLAFLVQNSSI